MSTSTATTARPEGQRIDLLRLHAARRPARAMALPRLCLGERDRAGGTPVLAAAQLLLRPYYATITVDGLVGTQTRAAVLAFQSRCHRASTGLLAPADWSLLLARSIVTIGSRGAAVQAVQQLLNARGGTPAQIVVDGLLGTGTSMVLRDLQARSGLRPDAVVGPATYAVLLDTRVAQARLPRTVREESRR